MSLNFRKPKVWIGLAIIFILLTFLIGPIMHLLWILAVIFLIIAVYNWIKK
ncbi:MAG TPA: hypothetical protein VJB94_05145 [Candidatus Nanoarchaeia archaeon]|nr:hypothetical protein [Candidatus Nanoarchaeia archaeon]